MNGGQDGGGDALEEAGGPHDGAKGERTEDEPDRVQHAGHATCGQQVIHDGVARHDGRVEGRGRHQRGEGRTEVGFAETEGGANGVGSQRPDDVGLGDQCRHRAAEHPEEERRDGRHLSRNERDDPGRYEEQPPMEVEVLGENVLQPGGPLHVGRSFGPDARQRKDHQGDEDAGDGGPQHEADVREEVGARDGRSEVGGVGQRGQLVAEIGAGDDGTGRPALTQSQGLPNADQGHPHGAHGAPARSCRQTHGGTQDARGRKKDVLAQDVQPDIDEGGDDAGHQPGARQCADEQQDQDRANGIAKGLFDTRFEGVPSDAARHAQSHGRTRSDEEGHLVAAVTAVLTEGQDIRSQQEHQQEDGRQGGQQGGAGRGGIGHGVWGLRRTSMANVAGTMLRTRALLPKRASISPPSWAEGTSNRGVRSPSTLSRTGSLEGDQRPTRWSQGDSNTSAWAVVSSRRA